jgi:alpha-glucosidase (family GH31 glycosyl hydrolase)
MNRRILLCVIYTYLFQSQTLFSQSELFKSFIQNDSCVEVKGAVGKYQFYAYNDATIEVRFYNDSDTSYTASHAVKAAYGKNLFTVKDQDNILSIYTKSIAIEVDKLDLSISYKHKNRLILEDNFGFQSNAEGIHVNFSITPEEALYGGGARALGLNRRGHKLELYNKAHYGYEEHSELMNYSMPVVLSSNKYLIHFDNPQIGYLDLDSENNNKIKYESIGGRKVYQIIVGENYNEILKYYTSVTGRQPLPPRWALGNFASRFGYHSQQETENTVELFLKEGIPLDAVILDLYWFGKDIQGTMGNLEFYTDSFPTPKKMIDDFKSDGIKTVLITEPFILTTSSRWKEAYTKGILARDSLGKPFTYDFYFGNTGLIDIYSNSGYNWFWQRYKELIEMGIEGFWGDLGEPEVHPKDLWHQTGSANEKHNVYGHDWAGLLHDSYKKDYPDKRPFILMRSGYSGSQRYGIIPWSGDVNRTWGGLKSQTEIALEMGMQGIGYMHSDLGGFAGAKDDSELYVRWLQYGVFQPIFRPHAQESVPSEPVFKDDITKDLAKRAIQLRYSLLPYNYTLAKENSETGMPLMRPLLFECENDINAQSISTTYLWGHSFLVTPLVDSGAMDVTIHFPTNSIWFDFQTNERYDFTNSQSCIATKSISVNINTIPVFVRAGSFVPRIENLKSTEDYFSDTIEIHFYYDKSVRNSNGRLYEDDGFSNNPNRKYNDIAFKFSGKKKKGIIEIESCIQMSEQATYKLIIHHPEDSLKKIIWKGTNEMYSIQKEIKNQSSLFFKVSTGKNELVFKMK